MKRVVPLEQAHDDAIFVSKAVGLGQAIRDRLPVPPGVALSGSIVEAVAAGEQRAIKEVAKWVQALGGPLAVRSSATVIKEGSGGAAFFVIESGEATIVIRGKARTTLKPGDYFGEIALIDEGTRTATITASSELVCYGLTYWDFRPLVEANGVIAGSCCSGW